MSHFVILGAGFSFALSSGRMPLTDALGSEIGRRLRSQGLDVPSAFSGGRFETWLSRLAEAQPDIDEVTNARNHALFLQISELVRSILVEAQNNTVRHPPPWMFQRLIGALHARQSVVATFNYDTLVERLIETQRRLDWQSNYEVKGHHAIQGRPPQPYAPGTAGDGPATTFQLLKLHGSVDTFWVSGDTTGATINRLGHVTRWAAEAEDSEIRRLTLPGRVPFIVPPAAAKSAFYANPFTRQLWRDAADGLRRADTVDIVGYSMPVTDLVTSGMLADTLTVGEKRIRVVNKYPNEVVEHLVRLGCDRSAIEVFEGDDSIPSYAQMLESGFDPLRARPKQVEFLKSQNALLCVGLNNAYGATVTSVNRDPANADIARVQVEPVGEQARVNRVRHGGEHVSSLEDLLGASPPTRVVVEFEGGVEAAVVDVASWGESFGHHGSWLRLVPSAMPDNAYRA